MTDTPKDKRAAALERIKALASRRSSTAAEPSNTKNTPSGGSSSGAAKHGSNVGHRPQGG